MNYEDNDEELDNNFDNTIPPDSEKITVLLTYSMIFFNFHYGDTYPTCMRITLKSNNYFNKERL